MIPVVELYGSTLSVSVVSVSQASHPSPITSSLAHKLPSMNTMMDSLEVVLDASEKNEKEAEIRIRGLEFHENHGRNVQLKNRNTTAIRTDSYNQGMLLTSRPLKENEIFEVKLDRLNNRWTSSLMIGALFESPEKLHLPVTALGLKKNAIVINGDTLYQNGHKVETLGFNIDTLNANQSIGVVIDSHRNLKVLVNGQDFGIAVQNVPPVCYGLLDLYGQCEEITIVKHENEASNEASNSILEDHEKDLITSMHNPIILRTLNQAISSSSSKGCEYFKMCSRFKASLALPNHFFQQKSGNCHCIQCTKLRGEELYVKKGDPPKDFALPLHWTRFPVKPTKAEPTTETWHTTYHGTKPSSLRKILDHGELIPLQVLGSGLAQKLDTRSKESKEDDSDTPQLVFSPTLSYFLKIPQSCSSTPFQDHKKKYLARLAFEVDIHPGSYKIGPPTMQGILIDSHFKLDETEWLTKEKGNTVIKALLVHLEQVL